MRRLSPEELDAVIPDDMNAADGAALSGHIAALEEERDDALAGNAALAAELRAVLSVLWGPDFERRPAEASAQRLLAQPHPGAALLGRMKKMESVLRLALTEECMGIEDTEWGPKAQALLNTK